MFFVGLVTGQSLTAQSIFFFFRRICYSDVTICVVRYTTKGKGADLPIGGTFSSLGCRPFSYHTPPARI